MVKFDLLFKRSSQHEKKKDKNKQTKNKLRLNISGLEIKFNTIIDRLACRVSLYFPRCKDRGYHFFGMFNVKPRCMSLLSSDHLARGGQFELLGLLNHVSLYTGFLVWKSEKQSASCHWLISFVLHPTKEDVIVALLTCFFFSTFFLFHLF